MEENKAKKKSYYLSVLLLMLLAVVVVCLNIVLIFSMTTKQTNTLGQQKLESVKTSLQGILDKAQYMSNTLTNQVDVMKKNGATESDIRIFITEQSIIQKEYTGGNCFNVCYSSPEYTVVPGYELEEGFDITTRSWYNEVSKKKVGDVYISPPYIDLPTGEMCFTVAQLLSDNKTAVSLDFNMDLVRNSISSEQFAGEVVLINDDGLIVSCDNASLLGKKIEDSLEQFKGATDRIFRDSNNEGSFSIGNNTYFYNCTQNGWYLILKIDRVSLYGESYFELIRNTVLSLVLLGAITFLIISNRKNREKMNQALQSREKFFGNLSEELSRPLDQIIDSSSKQSWDSGENHDEKIREIRDSALKLSMVMDNLFAYSGFKADEQAQNDKKKNKKSKKKAAKDKGNGIRFRYISVVLMIIVFLFTGAFVSYLILQSAKAELEMEAENAYTELNQWMSNRKSTVDVLAKTIEADPSALDDYDAMIKKLEYIEKADDNIGLVYFGNASAEHTVIMSDGWESPNYIVQAYSWYLDAISSNENYNISQPYFDTVSRSYYITISEAIYVDNGEFIGVIGVDFYLDQLTKQLEESYSDTGYKFLVTNSGSIVNHPSKEYKISTSRRTNIEETDYSAVLDSSSYVRVVDYDGVLRLCLMREDSISGFKVFVLRDWSSIYGGKIISASIFLVIFLAGIILILVMINRVNAWDKERNLQLQQALDSAQDADQAKSRFLAQISHELRTPINAVLGMDEILIRECKDENALHYADDIRTAGTALLELVNSLLDFSKIENDRMELSPAEYKLSEMLGDAVNNVRDRAKTAGLELVSEIDEDLPSVLFGDDMRIRQIIVNLLTNAVKYTHEGSVTFRVSGQKVDNGNIELTIAVQDTGIGIKDEDIKQLCTSFARFDSDKNRHIEGTGLGLYIVNKLLEMMDSSLEIESKYGQGSIFSFTVRQKIVDEKSLKELGSETENSKYKIREDDKFLLAREASVLIVDDNAVNLKVAAGLLKRTEIQVMTADSGNDAIDYLELNDYDIVLLDHMMPGKDGIETLHEIREKNLAVGVPIIAMTANAIVGAREEYLAEGFDDYLSKPVGGKELEEMLAKWLPEDKYTFVTEGELAREQEEPSTKMVQQQSIQIAKTEDNNQKDEELENFKKAFPEIDVNKGLICCGNKEFYFDIIKEFAKSEFDLILEKHLEIDDLQGYRTQVHALKSNARMIGAMSLGDEAYELEMASKEENHGKVNELHPNLLKNYLQLVDKIKKYFI